jgi:hypothetical protein
MELERLFRQIVLNLAATDPGRVHGPLRLGEIRDSIVPYRAYRRTLQIETSEDYELALIRLVSGEGGLATADSAEVADAFAEEAGSPNPDLAIIQRYEKAELQLNLEAAARVLEPESDLRFAPRQSPISLSPKPARSRPRSKAVPAPAENTPDRCRRCTGTLPSGRVINFCPQCGYNLTLRHCTDCGSELESDWKHCVSCGVSVASPATKGRKR